MDVFVPVKSSFKMREYLSCYIDIEYRSMNLGHIGCCPYHNLFSSAHIRRPIETVDAFYAYKWARKKNIKMPWYENVNRAYTYRIEYVKFELRHLHDRIVHTIQKSITCFFFHLQKRYKVQFTCMDFWHRNYMYFI